MTTSKEDKGIADFPLFIWVIIAIVGILAIIVLFQNVKGN